MLRACLQCVVCVVLRVFYVVCCCTRAKGPGIWFRSCDRPAQVGKPGNRSPVEVWCWA
jgi:hypothetical protein